MSSTPAEIVTNFYHAISAGDAETIANSIDTHFADDAAIEWPPSLPHGGRVQGSRKLRAIFRATADPNATAGAKNLELIRAIGDGDEVVAWICFDWARSGAEAAPNQALELWTFEGGLVRNIRAFYWDTDAIASPQPA